MKKNYKTKSEITRFVFPPHITGIHRANVRCAVRWTRAALWKNTRGLPQGIREHLIWKRAPCRIEQSPPASLAMLCSHRSFFRSSFVFLSLSLPLSHIDSSISFAILFHSLEVLIENVFSLIKGIIDISRRRIGTSGESCAAHHHYITRAYEQNLRTDSPSPAVTEDARFWKWTLLPAANHHER